MTDAALFGLELRRARERRALSLDQIAEATKVSGALFAGLERGDVSRWPGGIFRRAFLRAYAQAIGLDAEDIVARFLRIYPEADGSGVCEAAPATSSEHLEESAPRLVLDETATASRSTGAWLTSRRLGAAALDLLVAGIPAGAASLAFGGQWFFPMAALVGTVGHLASIAWLGVTPGSWLLLPRPPVARRLLDEEGQARRRAEAEPAAAHRRRQPRHASAPARPVPVARTRRIQH